MIAEGCKDCPFRSYHHYVHELGDQDINYCELIRFGNKNTILFETGFIGFTPKGNVRSKNKLTLDNCPILYTRGISIMLNKKTITKIK